MSGTNSMQSADLLTSNFLSILHGRMILEQIPEPREELKNALVRVAHRVLAADMPTAPPPPPQGSYDHAQELAKYQQQLAALRAYRPTQTFEVFAESLLQFMRKLPNNKQGMWLVPAHQLMTVGPTVAAMIGPFYKLPRGVVLEKYEQGARIAAERKGSKDWIWPERYDGPDILSLYLLPEFEALFKCAVPFGVDDKTRFSHQWIMASWGKGKTNLLSNYIKNDIERVARGECSILVMDSQERLVPDIAKLKCFAPGQPLHDRLIYIEPSVQYPPALNMFHRERTFENLSEDDRYKLKMATMEILEFFFSSALKLTDKQETPFQFILSAVMEVPNATIFTFRDMLKDDGWVRYREVLLDRLDGDTIEWFEEHYRPRVRGEGKDVYAETRQEISHRVENIYKDELFRKMFSHPVRKFDLFEGLGQGKVILINSKAAMLRKNLEAWGRFFIVQLLQAVEERVAVGRTENMPCFCYIDEAGDYIAREPNLKKIYRLARKQHIGMTIAHHDEQDIEDARVMAALRGSAIQVTPAKEYAFHFDIDDQPRLTIRAPEVDFSDGYDQMSPEDWDTVLAEQRDKYCVVDPRTRARSPARSGPLHVDSHDED